MGAYLIIAIFLVRVEMLVLVLDLRIRHCEGDASVVALLTRAVVGLDEEDGLRSESCAA